MAETITKTILLDTVEKVKALGETVFDTTLTVDITSGRYIVDAKSIMGIFSLNLSNPVTLVIHNNNETECERLLEELEDRGLITE